MKNFILIFTFLQLIYAQFNTESFGSFGSPGVQNPFGNQQFQSFGSQPRLSQSNNPYNYQQQYVNRGYNNELSGNPYKNIYTSDTSEDSLKCPQHWVQFQQSCYRFIKSPIRARNDARKNCQSYESDLVSINSFEEHGFLIYQLLWRDPQHRKWYTSAKQQSPTYWVNEADGSPLLNMENAFLPEHEHTYGRDYLVYRSVMRDYYNSFFM